MTFILRSVVSVFLVSVMCAVVGGCGGGSSSASPAASPVLSASAVDGGVVLKWSEAPGAWYYNIYMSTSPGVTPANGAKTSTLVNTAQTGVISGSASKPYTSLVRTGLTNGVTYHFVVTAVTGQGESAPSPEMTVIPSTDVTTPLIVAHVGNVLGPFNPFYVLQNVYVYDRTGTVPIANATVTVNGIALSYGPDPGRVFPGTTFRANQAAATSDGVTVARFSLARPSYSGNIAIAPGAPVSVTVTIGNTTYTASGAEFDTFPNVTTLTPGTIWQVGVENIIPVADVAPVAGGYSGELVDSTGMTRMGWQLAVPQSISVPANELSQGTYYVVTGIGDGIGSPLPIQNAAAESGLRISSFSVCQITAQ